MIDSLSDRADLPITPGVTAKGAAYCWGYKGHSELGDGTTNTQTIPVLVAGGFQAVSAGGYHTCGVRDGAVYCWGYGANGQLGNGTTTNQLTPRLVVP